MIIWLDGVLGIGKTTIAKELFEKHLYNEGVFLDSDVYFEKMCSETPELAFCSMFPSDNISFAKYFRSIIENEMAGSNKDLIVAMALVRQESKAYLLDYLTAQNIPILHIILTAHKDVTKSRIQADIGRDQRAALITLDDSIKFLEENFHNAIWFDTENNDIDEIANQIFNQYLQVKENLSI